jgi:hypothetical protein
MEKILRRDGAADHPEPRLILRNVRAALSGNGLRVDGDAAIEKEDPVAYRLCKKLDVLRF